ncbi:TRAP transporter substrate-binding protein [Aureimonas phyllosphaerae]|uniref:Tripartite ATP-independent transporter DctP family solute receptor n=1 Tax=Aureimonas phyllosphaerae TaxID=1166078 RepID=A0A7W6C1V7_9HYPH|nr:TRAP transporter substrate-binding protein [Aureimonas phyllosphaerae]MBB3937961.1 tripartite ATP-independent transporter DctP family solute receptor [Aureimonas phyllosphaerae]MBB3961994.1 tripartite ATP-independent transporter DctP family solute receptor [Aureimonas phyllosphaerae]SFF52685.1 tripartite ATP-independent transporter solute receptor, DctP family [Aureimonas phyllosphaerae]
MFKTALLASAAALLAAGPALAQFQDRTIRVSNGVQEEHPASAGVKAMAACAAEKSGGAMKLQAFWGGTLGGDLQATQAVRSGTLEMVITSSSPLVGIVPALGVLDLPFLFNDEAEADAVLDGEFGNYLSSLLPAAGIVNLAYWENGFRHLTNSRKPVAKLEDLSGMKIRVMQNNIFLDTFKTIGANAVPMPGPEVFTALETRAIDGHENPYVNIETSRMYEVQEYITETKHAYTPFLVLYSKQLFDQLSAEEQAALTDCAKVGRDVQRSVSREQSAASVEKLKEEGMELTVLDPAEQERMREMVRPVYERHAAEIGQDVIDRAQSAIAEKRN